MTDYNHFTRFGRFLITTAALGISLIVLQHFAGFFNILVIAAILAIVFLPLARWLAGKGAPGWLALLITMSVVVGVLIVLFLILVGSLGQLTDALPTYAAQIEIIVGDIQAAFGRLGLTAAESEALTEALDPAPFFDAIGEILASFVGVITDGVTVLLILAFLLVGARGFSRRASGFIATGNPLLSRLSKFDHDIRRYVIITNNVGLAAASINTVLFLIVGIDFALLWGVLSWLLSYIPFVGFLLALIPPVLLALLQYGWPTALFVLVALILINSVIDDVIKPRLMGQGLDLAPVVVLISVIFWGLILGPLGGLLAVPVTLGIKQLVLEPDPDSQWIAEMLSSDPQEAAGDDMDAA